MLNWIKKRLFKRRIPPEIVQARKLIRAIECGGIPLYPGKVNAIARNLGLDVSTRAPVEQTIERIRACLERAQSGLQ